MNIRPRPRYGPTDLTTIMPSPNTTTTAIVPLQPLRDALTGPARTHPASAHDLPLWRPGTAPNAPTPPAPPKRTEQTDIREVTHHVVSHVYKQRFNDLHTDLEAVPGTVATDHADVMRQAIGGIAVIIAELDAVGESLGFRTATVRRLGRSLAHGGDHATILAELQTLG